jgi:hypothetical protein
MPIAKVQLQDGRIARFEVPDGTTPDEVMQFANNQFGEQQPQQAQPRTPTQPTQYVEKNIEPQPLSRLEAFGTIATNLPLTPRLYAGVAALEARRQALAENLKQTNDLQKSREATRSISSFYDEALSNQLSKLRQAKEQYPKQSLGTQLATDIVGGGALLKGLGLAGNTAKQALTGGAILGGTTALGETRDISNLPQSLTDLGAGALVGGIGGVAGQQAGKQLGKLSKKIPEVVDRFKSRENYPKRAETILSKVITPEEAGKQASKLATKIEQGRITALPEQGDENILGLTRLLGKTQGSNKVIADYINKKSITSSKRVGDLINKNISSENYFDSIDNIIKTRSEIASPLFKKGYEEGNIALNQAMTSTLPNNTRVGKIRELVNDDRIKNVIAKARQDYGINQDIPDVSIESLHGARQVVDDIINTAKRAGENNKARSYINLKQQLNNVIYDVAPTMKQADKTFAGLSALKNAQEEGLNIGKLRNGEEVKRYLNTLTDGEKETYKIGVKDYLLDKVMKTGDANSSARKIFSQPLEREKIKAVFNNPKQFEDFARRMDDEIKVFDTKQRIVGGSRTDFNIQEGAELLDKVAKGAVNAKTFGISNIILASADAIKKRYYGLNEQTAKELAIIIVNPQKSVEVLNRIYQKAQTPQEKMLIQKFAENLANRNFTSPISAGLGRSQATEQLKEENNNGI